jgi:hypothetical protein
MVGQLRTVTTTRSLVDDQKAAAYPGDTRAQRVFLTSCASSPPPNGSQPNPQAGSEASALTRSPDSSSVGSENAEEVFNRIAAQVPTTSLVKVYTEDDDPNKLLGRPNGYTSKIAFADSRISKTDTEGTQKDAIERGGSIEVFPDADLAKGRADYIQGVLKNSGLGAEYDYLRGPVLVRVTGNLSPSKARDYEVALG